MNQFALEEVARIIAERGEPVATRAWGWYEENSDSLAPVTLDQSPRARSWRKIKRIAAKYPWGEEVIRRSMDDACAWTEDEMPADALVELLNELQRQDDRAMHACDDEDAPPAR